MIRFFRKRELSGEDFLQPIHDEDYEWLAKQKNGKQFKADFKATRNPDHHRKAFALFKLVADNHQQFESVDDVLLEMKLRSGHYVEQLRPGNSSVAAELRQHIIGRLRDTSGRDDMLAMVNQLEREAKMVFMPKSIAFDSLGQEDFEALYDRWVAIAGEMLGVEDETIRSELAEF